MADLGQSTIYGLTVATDLDVKGITTVRELRTTNTFVVVGIPDESIGTDGSASFQLERRDINNNYLDNFRVINIKESETSSLGVLKFQKQIGENGSYEDIFSIDTEKSLIVENNIDVKGEVIGKVSSLTATINDSASDARGVYFYDEGDVANSGKLLYSNNFTYTPNSKTLKVSNITTTSNAAVGGTLTVSGAATLNKTLNVTGNTTLNATTINTTLTVTGATTLGSTLSVSGVTTLDNTLTVTGATTLKSTLGVSNNTTIGGTLDVTSKTTLATLSAGTTTLNSLSVTGNSSLTGTLTVSGSSSLSTLSTSGLATLKSLSVTGNSTLTGNLDVTGTTAVGSHIIPSAINSCNLGSSDKYFNTIYVTNINSTSVGGKLNNSLTLQVTGATAAKKTFDNSTNVTFTVPNATTSAAGTVSTAAQSFAGIKTFTDSTASSSKITGAVVIAGGLGVGGAIYSNTLTTTSTITAGGHILASGTTGSLDIGSSTIKFGTVYANSFSGNAATATAVSHVADTSTNSNCPILFSSSTTTAARSVYFSTKATLNPSTGEVKIGKLSATTTILSTLNVTGATTLEGQLNVKGNIVSGGTTGSLNIGSSTIKFGTIYANTFNGTASGATTIQVTAASADINYYLTGANSVGGAGKSLYGSNSVYLLNNNIYANGFYATSSRKYKENIEKTSSSALDIIKQTEVVNFNYINDENKTPKIGIIAEDAPDILVSPDKGSVDTSNCIGVLLKACQELNERVETLEKEVTELKRKKSLKERIFGVKKNG